MSEHGGVVNSMNNNTNNPQNGAGRPLPKKEADLFKNLVKQYEMKQYKKAIKHADTILKKFPKHGETLAMKGLTYNYMTGHTREEAHALVKEGLKNDVRYVGGTSTPNPQKPKNQKHNVSPYSLNTFYAASLSTLSLSFFCYGC
jgi:tetratricopeptide (TPR) repeat protein